MGWYWTEEPFDRDAVRAEFARSWWTGNVEGSDGDGKGNGGAGKGHYMSVTGATWGAWDRTLWGVLRQDGRPVEILLWLVDMRGTRAGGRGRGGWAGGRGGSWGYKPMGETSGPNAVDCPLALLDACPLDVVTAEYPVGSACIEWATEWRGRVRAHWVEVRGRERYLRGLGRQIRLAARGEGEPPTVTLRNCAMVGIGGVNVSLTGTSATVLSKSRGGYTVELAAYQGGRALIRTSQIAIDVSDSQGGAPVAAAELVGAPLDAGGSGAC